MRRYLFGPVTRSFAEQNLECARATGNCLAFGLAEGLDLSIGVGDSWDTVLTRLPAGWLPEFVVLYLPYTTIPSCLWSAPVPLIGLAADWNLLWHYYRRCLPLCDLVLTDTAGVEVLKRQVIHQVHKACLFGCERAFLERTPRDVARDIDILFVGNVHPVIQGGRLAWLARLAHLSERWHVRIESGVFGDAYRELLTRARIVFNRSIRGECNKRVFEAAAAGALLFQEAENLEIQQFFTPDEECVLYDDRNLRTLLEYYLEHEDERRAIAERAQRRAEGYRFECLWEAQQELIKAEWPSICKHREERVAEQCGLGLTGRLWQALASEPFADRDLARDLACGVTDVGPTREEKSHLHNALGVATALQERAENRPVSLAALAGYFRRALASNPAHPVAALNLAETLALSGDRQAAHDAALRGLALLRHSEDASDWIDAGHFPLGFDCYRVEWEKAAWSHAGNPVGERNAKRTLVEWRLRALLAELTGNVADSYEAVLLRPDLLPTQALLGNLLVRAGRPADALSRLRFALDQNPFDVPTSRLLFQTLGQVKDEVGQRRLAVARRALCRAAARLVPAEDWFMQCPPVGDELVSIIILACNELEYTRLCLESILRCTRPPYELILIDNASTDGMGAYFKEIAARRGPARVAVICNDTNLGFAGGCNQGVAAARGAYLVFLNNDTVVTDGWLDGLVAWAIHNWPNTGLVGPVTNYAAPPQQIGVTYANLQDMERLAAHRRQEFARKALVVKRLTGFCLLVRREVLERVGSFDEQFALGFFEDDDLCVRAREAGFGLLVALNVFIHHFGSRTFAGLGIDCRKQLQKNFEQFKEKWGPERAAGYRFPESEPHTDESKPQANEVTLPGEFAPSMPATALAVRVSLCMIVKNEEDNLPDCLRSIADLVDEMIIVDTGSTDQTKAIAASFGARVVEFAWVDSFAAARNEGLRHATGDWIFWMDADDRIDQENRDKLRRLFALLGRENAAYSMKCLCLPNPETGAATRVDHIRLFRHHPEMQWQYRVHEQILPSVRRLGGEVRWSDVVIQHAGYQDKALRRRKLDRDLRLLQLEDADRPDDPFTLFNLGMLYLELDRTGDAISLLKRSLERSHPGDSIVRKLYALLVQAHRRLGERELALRACLAGRELYPEDTELLFQEGLLRRELGEPETAEACLLRLLEGQEGAHFASVDTGLRGHKARHNLAILYQEQGRWAEAEAQWRAALTEQPAFAAAWLGLAELLLMQARWGEAEPIAERLTDCVSAKLDATVLRARIQLGRRDFASARKIIDEAIRMAPNAVWPRVVLTHVLLQEGTDLPTAEQALRAVLAIDPDHAEARRNLSVLQANRQRHLETVPA
jgi:GT2 family glycosyltransferase/tetratricopeptide (TPR) repeat protein